ncbi:prephenate dehydrogenase/arogenate dehydrogenase family protein [Aquihabitans sp. McL0605]|uniref:prephenate dehydrogenase/arogenate dehydrogenase family protein n=1 Tax=Aquihabitans sp. McL0605 TaxID=3415671 RepID=UPI003CE84C83
MADLGAPQRAAIIGTGLIGGSIGLALRARGWQVSGTDADPAAAQRALELGAIDAIGIDPAATITFVAAPVRSITTEVRRALEQTAGVVTDVGSVKASLVAEIDHPRFVGGHPMAGSEQLGVEGSSPDMFQGAVWVLTPVAHTDADQYATVDAVVRSLGAEVVALAPERHDALVAVVSHVPHLTAAALMSIADERADEHAALLRLAAGGFRDMTRIAAGTPTIWPDICGENRVAIVEMIDQLTGELGRLRSLVAEGDHDGLLTALERAQEARRNLPSRIAQPAAVAEVRVPVPDRGGVIAEVATLAAELDVNIADFEIAHSSEGDRGVLILLVDRTSAEPFRAGLADRGYKPTVTYLQ